MRLKIISEGRPESTQVVNLETGEPLENVLRVTWSCSADSPVAIATITLQDIPLYADNVIPFPGPRHRPDRVFRQIPDQEDP